MNRRVGAVALLVVQLALVLSVAGKYLYERKTRPRVWVRTAQFDPNAPLRGRYLALQLAVDACGLPHEHDKAHFSPRYQLYNTTNTVAGQYHWRVSLAAQDGHLVPQLRDEARTPEGTLEITQSEDRGCDRVPVNEMTEFFIPDTAKMPFTLKSGQELWVEVTAPQSGPPRPIQLALSDASGFHPLRFE